MPLVTWNLKDLLPELGSKDYKNLLNDLEKNIVFVESFKGSLQPTFSLSDFMKILKTKEHISLLLSRLVDYAYLWFSQDTSHQGAKSYRATVEQLAVDAGNRLMFFSLWFKTLDEKNAQRIIQEIDPEYRYYLEFLRLTLKHTLTELEEKVINLKDVTGTNALIKVYDVVTNNFVFDLTLNGKKKKLTRSELTTYVKDSQAKVRKDAYVSLYKVYGAQADLLHEVYRNLVLDWKNESLTLRKYSSPISPRNLGNGISDKSVDVLIEVCRKNRTLFQDYFKLKAKLCTIKKMQRYDIYAAYREKKKKYTYEQAKTLVFDAYKAFSPKIFTLAKKIDESKHVDFVLRKNKMSGAYCMDVGPGITPYVLLNFNGDIRDVFTIAHEFGHGVHDLLTADHSPLTAHPPLVLAETASIFGEMLLFDKLLKEIKDTDLKKSLLINKLDDTYATICRQIYFILFEIEAHDLVAKGAGLDELNKAYLLNLKEQFGDSVFINDEFKYEWLSIPHIYHTPFYCYSYAFGNLLVLALYEQYKKEGTSFVEKYLKILSYGGSEAPDKILKEVGIDLEDPHFWQKGFDLVKEMLEELRDLK